MSVYQLDEMLCEFTMMKMMNIEKFVVESCFCNLKVYNKAIKCVRNGESSSQIIAKWREESQSGRNRRWLVGLLVEVLKLVGRSLVEDWDRNWENWLIRVQTIARSKFPDGRFMNGCLPDDKQIMRCFLETWYHFNFQMHSLNHATENWT